jgi:integrase
MTARYAIKTDNVITGSKAKRAPVLKYVITDGAGLYIEANHTPKANGDTPATPYQWRFNFKSPVTGERNRLSFGAFPAVGIADARALADKARVLIAAKQCPAAAREVERAKQLAAQAAHAAAQERAKANLSPVNSFKDIALQMIEKRRGQLAPSYVLEIENTLEKYAYPAFGDLFIGDVTVDHIHTLDKQLTAAGHMQMLKKLRRFCRHVFAYAIKPPLKLIQINPVFEDPDLFATTFTTERPAMETGDDAQKLMRAIKGWHRRQGGPVTVRNALLLGALTFQRPANISSARKDAFDLDAGVWVIPGGEMKGKTVKKLAGKAPDHMVFLATQTVAMLRAQFAAFPDSEWVFPSLREGTGKHINRDAMGAALIRMGFKDKHCAHGFRAMARTVGEDELDLSPIVLERALAHKRAKGRDGDDLNEDGGLGQSYARAKSFKKRAAAVQAWADYLDTLTQPQLALAA